MNKEQLNQIDEELARWLPKLQEMHELGEKTRTEQIIILVNHLLDKNNKLNEKYNGGYDDEISTLKLVLKKIKSLQTNKE